VERVVGSVGTPQGGKVPGQGDDGGGGVWEGGGGVEEALGRDCVKVVARMLLLLWVALLLVLVL